MRLLIFLKWNQDEFPEGTDAFSGSAASGLKQSRGLVKQDPLSSDLQPAQVKQSSAEFSSKRSSGSCVLGRCSLVWSG